MRRTRHSAAALAWTAFVTALGASMQAAAQAPPGGEPQRPVGQPPLELISLDFKGGTALEFIAAVKSKVGGKINIMAPAEAAEITVPPVTLVGVTAPTALQILSGSALVRGRPQIQLQIVPVVAQNQQEVPTYRVSAVGPPVARSGVAPPRVRVWSLGAVLEGGVTSETALSAVEMALQVEGDEAEPELRFHKETGLLVARGSEAQLQVISEVVDRLEESRQVRKMMEAAAVEREGAVAQAKVEKEARAGLEAELRGTQLEMERLRIHGGELQRMLDEARRRITEAESTIRNLSAALDATRKGGGDGPRGAPGH